MERSKTEHQVHLLVGLAHVTSNTLQREFGARLAIIRAYHGLPEYVVEYDTQEACIMERIGVKDTQHNTPRAR